MNAKAYGSEFSKVVESVDVVNENFELETLTDQNLDFSYKNSIFMKRKNLFIFKIKLKLFKDAKNIIYNRYLNNLNDRKIKGQFDFPSAGCIFKNNYDIGIPSGKIIEDLGLKGFRIGDAQIYEKHANFIINKNKAKSEDVLKLIEFIEKQVFEKKGIKLEREVQLLGFDK
jgi:UDP-N-acetylmuramate dehydrogenase